MKRDLEASVNSEDASNECEQRFDQRYLEPYMVIWESELQFTAGVAARWSFIEAGGEFFGSLTPGERLVIMLATGPGPQATHKVAEFTQDMDFFRKTDSFLRNNFGLHYLGNYHSHHILGIDRPSSIDIRSTNSIAQKNGYQLFAQFVLTYEKDRCLSLPSRNDEVHDRDSDDVVTNPRSKKNRFKDLCNAVKARVASPRQINFIQIHPYTYRDAAHGKPIRCPVRVLPGTSPFRRAIMQNSIIPELTTLYKFPTDRILVDSRTLSDGRSNHFPEVPTRISDQWLQLPENVREDARVTFKGGLIVLSFPISRTKRRILIGYNKRPPHRVEAVFLRQDERPAHPIEVSKEALCFGPFTSLARIYERVGCLINREISPTRQDDSIETVEKQGKKEEKTIEQKKESQTVKEGDEYLCR